MKGIEELRRLRNGPDPDEKLNGFFTESFVVRCPGNAEVVLSKAKRSWKSCCGIGRRIGLRC